MVRQFAAWSWGWVLALVVLALGPAGTAEAGSYTFTLIADASGAFTRLHSPPAVNASGIVVFTADLSAGGQGVFTGSGGALTTIAESGGPFLSVFGNTINVGGTVVVGAELAAGGHALLTGHGGFLTAIDTTPFTALYGRPSISADGSVAFQAVVAGGGGGIFARAGGGPVTIILPDTSALEPPPHGPTIDAAGVVVFGASIAGVGFGLFTGTGAAAPALIVDTVSGGFIDFGIYPEVAAVPARLLPLARFRDPP